MDYEKLHKDTIKKLQEMVNSGKITVETACGICADFVPESEDERIRKEIFNALKYLERELSWDTLGRVDILDAYAWLEKQDDKDEEILILKDQIESLHAAIKAIKETHKIELEKQGEQKPAWSEEDERNLYYWLDNNKSIGNDKYRWLLSLKDRVGCEVNCTTTKEWSEEDEEILYSIINNIEITSGRITLPESKVHYIKQINWLKSLKERYTWKPSDEQMKAFDAILVYNPPCSNECRNHLITLYNDLEKLKR